MSARIMAKESKHVKERKVLRKLGINETYQLAMYQIDQYRGTILSCRYAIPPHMLSADSRPQVEQAFKNAIASIVKLHPMLQVAMTDTTSKTPSWIQLPSLDLTQHIKWVYLPAHDDFEQTCQETFRTQLDEYFPDLSLEQPGWKLTILRQEDASIMEVVLAWNHPQFDGAGAKVLQQDLLEYLKHADLAPEASKSLKDDIFTLPQSPILPIPLELLLPLPIDVKFLAKALWEDIRPQFLTRDSSLAHWCPIRNDPYKTQFRYFFLPAASVRNILSLCRQNKTTITGLLNALALIAFSARLAPTAAPAFQSSTIVDHRRNLPPAPTDAPWGTSDRAVSNYVTQCLHKFGTEEVTQIRRELPNDVNDDESKFELSPALQTSLWRVAAQNRAEIARKLSDPLRNDIVGLFKWVSDWKRTMNDMVRKPRQFSWLVTNVGVLEGGGEKTSEEEDGARRGWAIERALFGLSAEVPAAAIEVAAISVKGGGMCVSANWTDCAVDVMFGERITGDLERWLGQLGREA